MSTLPNQHESRFRLNEFVRSDSLPELRSLLSAMPLLQQVFGQQLTVNAIVDANAVYRVLFWRLKTRQKPDARTTLEEALDSGVLVLIAPQFLKDEIDEKFSIIAAQTGSTPLEVRREWEQLQQRLRFYRPLGGTAVTDVADPDDLPYKFASDELGLPIYTRDKHLKQMGAPTIRVYIDTTLRDHARAMSVTLTTAVGSTYSVVVGFATLKAAGRGIKEAFDAFRRLPEWLQWTIAGALVAIAIHPRSRAKLFEMGRSFASTINGAKGSVLDGLLELLAEIGAAHAVARQTQDQIHSSIPPIKKVTAIVCARRVCVLAEGPLSLAEIARRMRVEGYVPRSSNPEPYLRRLLRESGQFIEMPDGWALRP